MTNEYGLDASYFSKNLRRILADVDSYTPAEMARALARLAVVANEGEARGVVQASRKTSTAPLAIAIDSDHVHIDRGGSAITVTKEDAKAVAAACLSLAPEFAEIGANILTQDNHYTAEPMFVVKEFVESVGADGYSPPNGGTQHIEWVDDDNNIAAGRRLRALEARYRREGDTEYKGWRRLAINRVPVTVAAFFTSAGAKNYIDINGHNLRVPFTYAEGSFRNAEFNTIREFLMAVGQFAKSNTADAAMPGFRLIPIEPPVDLLNAGWREFERLGGDPEGLELGAIYSAVIASITEFASSWGVTPAPAGYLWVPVELPVEILNAGWREHGEQGGDPEELELGDVWAAMMGYLGEHGTKGERP